MKPSLTRRIPIVRKVPMKRVGKRTIAWTKARAKLKVAFAAAGITRCEVCGSSFALGFAHSLPRRFVTCDLDMFEVALLCSEHHAQCDDHGHAHQLLTVKNIIANRPNPILI